MGKHYFKCLACGRQEVYNSIVRFYSIPRDRDRKVKWFSSIKKLDLLDKIISTDFRVCEDHFSDDMYGKSRQRLKLSAVPVLNNVKNVANSAQGVPLANMEAMNTPVYEPFNTSDVEDVTYIQQFNIIVKEEQFNVPDDIPQFDMQVKEEPDDIPQFDMQVKEEPDDIEDIDTSVREEPDRFDMQVKEEPDDIPHIDASVSEESDDMLVKEEPDDIQHIDTSEEESDDIAQFEMQVKEEPDGIQDIDTSVREEPDRFDMPIKEEPDDIAHIDASVRKESDDIQIKEEPDDIQHIDTSVREEPDDTQQLHKPVKGGPDDGQQFNIPMEEEADLQFNIPAEADIKMGEIDKESTENKSEPNSFKEEDIELLRLRKENIALKEKIKMLEMRNYLEETREMFPPEQALMVESYIKYSQNK